MRKEQICLKRLSSWSAVVYWVRSIFSRFLYCAFQFEAFLWLEGWPMYLSYPWICMSSVSYPYVLDTVCTSFLYLHLLLTLDILLKFPACPAWSQKYTNYSTRVSNRNLWVNNLLRWNRKILYTFILILHLLCSHST